MANIFTPTHRKKKVACITCVYDVAFVVHVFPRRFWDGPCTSPKYTIIGTEIYGCTGQFLFARSFAILKISIFGPSPSHWTLVACPNIVIRLKVEGSWNHKARVRKNILKPTNLREAVKNIQRGGGYAKSAAFGRQMPPPHF